MAPNPDLPESISLKYSYSTRTSHQLAQKSNFLVFVFRSGKSLNACDIENSELIGQESCQLRAPGEGLDPVADVFTRHKQ